MAGVVARLGSGLDSDCDPFQRIGVRREAVAGTTVFRQGDKAEYVCRVVSGTARSYRLLGDGRRQAVQFHFAGDVLGLEAETDHRTTAEVVEDSVLLMVRRSSLTRLSQTDGAIARALWSVAVAGHRRSQDHALVLSRQGACERLAAFLLDVAARKGVQTELDLPMSRQDIADHLGLTIHTVSRSFTELQARGWIATQGPRRVRLERRIEMTESCE